MKTQETDMYSSHLTRHDTDSITYDPVVSTRFPKQLTSYLKQATGQRVSEIVRRLLYAEVERLRGLDG